MEYVRIPACYGAFVAGLLGLLFVEAGLAQTSQNLKVSYSQRMRIETTDDATHLSNDAEAGSSYLRNRMSLTLQATPANHLTVLTRLTDEFRYYMIPETRKFTLDELFFELLYVKWDSAAGLPVDLTLGRQNLMLGEGFVVMDGGPLDGSRSAYFNAATLAWHIDAKSVLSVSYANQQRQDDLLPVIHDQHRDMVERPEEAIILSYAGAIGQLGFQAYAIHKDIEPIHQEAKGDYISCPGIRLQLPIGTHLTSTAEAAWQMGKWQGEDQFAIGGYGYVEFNTGWPIHFPRNFTVGGLYLSGDDPGTADYEGWEPMFGRWPKWSESYIYTLVRERGVAYWTNLASVFARTSIEIVPNLVLALDYHHLMAPELDEPARAFPGGRGRTRGDLVMGKLSYTMNEHVSGHFIYEGFEPGSYYFDGASHYGWSRMEIMLNF